MKLHVIGSDYIANILESRARKLPEPGALHLTRRTDLLDLSVPAPDLSVYEKHDIDSVKSSMKTRECQHVKP
jgi:hypothetical protein